MCKQAVGPNMGALFLQVVITEADEHHLNVKIDQLRTEIYIRNLQNEKQAIDIRLLAKDEKRTICHYA